MTQRERDRLVALKKADQKLITQKQAAQQIGLSERQLRRLLVRLRKEGDHAVIHAARGRASNRKISAETEKRAVAILSRTEYVGFGPTLAAEYLEQRHGSRVGRETLRGCMSAAGLWKPRRRRLDVRTCGGSGAAVAANCCNGTPPSTTGWRDAAARSCT